MKTIIPKDASQLSQLRIYLDEKGDISPAEAREVMGIQRLAARIEELRRSGLSIRTVMKRTLRGQRYTRYYLEQ